MKVSKGVILLICTNLVHSKTYKLLDVISVTYWNDLSNSGAIWNGLGCKVLRFVSGQITQFSRACLYFTTFISLEIIKRSKMRLEWWKG